MYVEDQNPFLFCSLFSTWFDLIKGEMTDVYIRKPGYHIQIGYQKKVASALVTVGDLMFHRISCA